MGGVKMERRGREWEIFNVVLDMHGVWLPNDFHLFLLPVCAIKVKLNAEIMGFSCSRSLPHIPLQCSDSTFCLWVAASLFLSFFPPSCLAGISILSPFCVVFAAIWKVTGWPIVCHLWLVTGKPYSPFLPHSFLPHPLLPLYYPPSMIQPIDWSSAASLICGSPWWLSDSKARASYQLCVCACQLACSWSDWISFPFTNQIDP